MPLGKNNQTNQVMKQGREKSLPSDSETATRNDQDRHLQSLQSPHMPEPAREAGNPWPVEMWTVSSPTWGQKQTMNFQEQPQGCGRWIIVHALIFSPQANGFFSALLMWSQSALVILHWGEFNPNCSTNKGELKWSASIVTWVNRPI